MTLQLDAQLAILKDHATALEEETEMLADTKACKPPGVPYNLSSAAEATVEGLRGELDLMRELATTTVRGLAEGMRELRFVVFAISMVSHHRTDVSEGLHAWISRVPADTPEGMPTVPLVLHSPPNYVASGYATWSWNMLRDVQVSLSAVKHDLAYFQTRLQSIMARQTPEEALQDDRDLPPPKTVTVGEEVHSSCPGFVDYFRTP